MRDIAWGCWLGACLLMIRYADTLPFWADFVITMLGFAGIIASVILNRSPRDEAVH